MSNIRKIDTSLAQMIAAMKIDPNKASICVVDAESTRLLGGGGIIWDFGYTFADVREGKAKTPKGSLVYESLKDQRLIDEISGWNKIRHTYQGDLYDFYALLKENNWWNDEVLPKQDIDKQIREVVTKKAEDQLQRQTNIRKVAAQKALVHKKKTKAFNTPGSPTREHYENRMKEVKESYGIILKIQKFLRTGDNLEKFIKSGALSSNLRLSDIKSQVYSKLYWDQKREYSDKDYHKDSVLFKELKISYNIDRWGTIMQTFEEDLKAEGDKLLAISAYNIGGAEQRFIRQTCMAYGAGDPNILERYSNICAMYFAKMMRGLDVEKIIDGISSYDPDFMARGIAKSLSKEEMSTEGLTMEMWYQNIFENKKYTESHTAMADSYDTAAAMAKVIKEEIVSILNKK